MSHRERGYDGGGGGSRPLRVSLVVRNLPLDIRAEDLRSKFEKYGELKDVYIPRDYYTQRPRGFGFVEFKDTRDAEDAMYALDRSTINGREISVTFSREGRKTPRDMMKIEARQKGYDDRRDDRRRSRSRSPRRRYSRSPRRSRSRSPRRSRSRDRERYRSPRGHDRSRDREPERDRDRSRDPERDWDRSRDLEPDRDRERSRDAERDRGRSRDPERDRSRDPERDRSRDPERDRSRDPERDGDREYASPRERSRSKGHSPSPRRDSPPPQDVQEMA